MSGRGWLQVAETMETMENGGPLYVPNTVN